jgi:hypothetical protein
LNGSIKPPGGENGRDEEASTFLAEGAEEATAFGRSIKENLKNLHFCDSLNFCDSQIY